MEQKLCRREVSSHPGLSDRERQERPREGNLEALAPGWSFCLPDEECDNCWWAGWS